jgi:eukaryotic-like serine/threonine-protein kinase
MPTQECPSIGVGQTLGNYRIDALLGAGGMGTVYRAWDCELERTVAIKVVDQGRSGSDAAHRLLQEARLGAALCHPSICGIHEVAHVDGCCFIVMEHVEGSPLASLIPEGQGLPLDLALPYATQIVDAVAHAHGRGIIHRDLKSSNIMIAPDGRAKLLDFGLAVRHMVDADAERAGQIETTCSRDASSAAGTVPYMAPELLLGRPANARSDIWALGVLIYEMVTGRRPFRGATRYELGAAILGQRAVPLPSGLPASVCAVVARSLEKDPDDRFPCAHELATALALR